MYRHHPAPDMPTALLGILGKTLRGEAGLQNAWWAKAGWSGSPWWECLAYEAWRMSHSLAKELMTSFSVS